MDAFLSYFGFVVVIICVIPVYQFLSNLFIVAMYSVMLVCNVVLVRLQKSTFSFFQG